MADPSLHPDDPFTDHAQTASSSNQDLSEVEQNGTLLLGRNVSLTLATDSLIILDDATAPIGSSLTTCCGLIASHTLPRRLQRSSHLPTRSIPYYNVLAASLNDFNLEITHASPPSSRSRVVRPTTVSYPVSKDQRTLVAAFLHTLLSKAYPANTKRRKRIKVLVNPFGGKGSAAKWYHRDIEPVFRAAECTLFVEHTRYKGHAAEIAEHLDTSMFDVVACCSGDGLPHEVFNGLARQPRARQALKRIAVVQLPCGSGNAMSWNLNGTDSPSLAALAVIKGVRTPLDLCAVTQVADGEEQRYVSFLSQSVGIVAESDLGTDHLRWMGDTRFTWGILSRLLGKTVYPCDIAVKLAVDKKGAIRKHCREYNGQNAARIRATKASSTESSSTTDDDEADAPLPELTTSISRPIDTSDGWTPLTPFPTLGNFYAGNMPYMAASTNFFPAALPADGCLDLITIDGQIPRWEALKMLMSVSEGKIMDFKDVQYRKVKAYRIVPRQKQGYISIDGERVRFGGFQVEVMEAAGCVLSRRGAWEAPVFE